MGVNSLPKTVTRQRRDCDLNPGPSVPESSTLTTRLPSLPSRLNRGQYNVTQSSKYLFFFLSAVTPDFRESDVLQKQL